MNIEPGKAASAFIGFRRDQRRLGRLVPNPKAKLQDQFHEVARFKYLSGRTESTYWQWVVRFLKFHRGKNSGNARPHPGPLPQGEGVGAHGGSSPNQGGWIHPRDLSAQNIAEFLSDLSSRLKVAAATQAQALQLVEG